MKPFLLLSPPLHQILQFLFTTSAFLPENYLWAVCPLWDSCGILTDGWVEGRGCAISKCWQKKKDSFSPFKPEKKLPTIGLAER